MVPYIAAPYLQTPPPVSDAVINGLTDAAVGRLPATIVAPPVPASSADLQLRNNTNSLPRAPLATSSTPSSAAIVSAASAAAGATSQNISFQPSSPFLAQLIAQIPPNVDVSSSLAFQFASGERRFVDYPTMLAFGTTRYAPSYASLPRSEVPQQTAESAPRPATPAPAPAPAQAQPVKIELPAAPTAQAQNTTATSSANLSAAVAQAFADAPRQVEIQLPQPAVTPRQGAGAYRTTAERNDTELGADTLTIDAIPVAPAEDAPLAD